MSKENIIGIILLLLVMIFMFTPFYQKMVGVKQAPRQDEGFISHSTNTPKDSVKSTIIKQTQKSDEKFVYIRTNLYEATLTSKGGDIINFKLLKYKDFKGNPVELINRKTYLVQLKLEKGVIRTDSIYFMPDAESLYTTEQDTTATVNFTATTEDGIGIIRRYEFHHNSYIITHHIFTASTSNNPVESAQLWLVSGMRPTEKNPRSELRYIKGVILYGDELIRKGLGNKPIEEKYEGTTLYSGLTSKYFTILLANEIAPANESYIKASLEPTVVFDETLSCPHFETGLNYNVNKEYFKSDDILYIGPQDYFALKKLGRSFEKVVDLGWKIFRPIAIAFLFVFVKLHDIFPNYGIVIIIFSLLIKILLHPLNLKMLSSMRKMKELEPKIKAIQQQYKSDPQKINIEIMRLYREHKINPFSGCLPMLLQMPVFFALYQVLSYTIELRASPFVLWVRDLSQKDPYLILPLLMSLTQFIQQKMSTKDPKQMGMVYIMPVVFFFIFMSFPSGLVLYWTTFNIFTIITQYFWEKSVSSQQSIQ